MPKKQQARSAALKHECPLRGKAQHKLKPTIVH
jgi:hypothetical protein